ncbi:MAG: hypothetical protein ACLVG5_08795 [Clostridium sp.]
MHSELHADSRSPEYCPDSMAAIPVIDFAFGSRIDKSIEELKIEKFVSEAWEIWELSLRNGISR